MSPKRFSQHIANVFPVPARAVLAALAFFIALAALAGLLLLLSSGLVPVTAAPAITDSALDLSGPLQLMAPLTATTTTITRTSGNSPSTFGDPLTFRATVTRNDTGGSVGAVGTVTFKDNGVNIPGCVGMSLDVLGKAECSTSSLSVGEHIITAHYSGGGDFDPSTSGGLGQSVNKTTVTVTISVDDNTPVYGQEVEFYADVEPSACSGIVFFDDGGTEIGRATLDGGTATVKTFRLGAGPHRVKAVYLGTENCYEGESDVLDLDVAKANTDTSVSSSLNPSEYGQYVTFTAAVAPSTVRPGATTPTGLVTFIVDGMPLGQGTLDGDGEATFTTAELAATESTCWWPDWFDDCNWPGAWAGHVPHSVTAEYEGDANYSTSTGDLEVLGYTDGQYVNRAATEVVMTKHDPSPSKYGQSVTFTAEVKRTTAGIGTPTGKVVFKGWAGDDFEASLFAGSNEVTFMTMEPLDADPNPYTIEAEYHGDDNFQFSEVEVNHTVEKAPTTTELQDPLSETDYGQDAQFTISVKRHEDYPGLGIPTGTVTLTISGGPPDSIAKDLPDTGSVVTIVTNTLRPGDHDITAEYGGDSNFEGSTSDTVTHTVNKADSETTLVSSVNPSAFGQSVTFTATVEAAGLGFNAPITPTGTVTFTADNGTTTTVIGVSSEISPTGVATATTTLDAGEYEVTAEYSGDTNFKPSEDSLRQTVNTIATTTKLDGPVSSAIGDSVDFTATVSETLSGDPVTDGVVTFYDGVTVLGTETLVAGVATYNTSSLSEGLHPLKAVYNGTANFQASTSQRLYHTVGAVGSSTALTSSPASPTVFGQTVTFTATVTGSGTPTGQVTFKDGAATIGTKTLVGGVATLTKSNLSVSTHPIKAVYGGDGTFAGSTSNQVDHQVIKADTTTTITSDLPDPSVFGQPVVVNFTVVASGDGSGTPTGNVTVDDGAGATCVGSVGSAGSCTLMFSTPGNKTLTATYASDANFNSSSSSGESHDVDPADTTTTVTSSPNPSVTDQEVTITANVTANSPGAGTPTGQVQFKSNGSNIGGPVALVGGSASVTHTFTVSGTFTIAADYTNTDGNFEDSDGSTTHNVNPTPPDLSVTKTDSPDPVNVGDNLTYVINVTNNEADSVNVTLVDTLPSKVSFVSAPGCTHDGSALGGVVTCDLGSLAGGASTSVTIIVNVPIATPAGTVLSNTAQAGAHSDTEETTVYRSFSSGDCNGDYAVNLADVWSIVRHIFDPTFQGTSGCDANQDRRVDAGDVPSTVLIMLDGLNNAGGVGGDLNAATEGPALTLPDQVPAVPGGLVTLPVSFDANGHSITSLIFSVDYDETWLALDPADRDGNGIPDAMIFSLPGDFTYSVTFDEDDTDGEVDIFIGDISPPLTSLSDGPVVYMILDVASSPGETQRAVRFALDPAASFGDTSGQSVPGTATPIGRYLYQIYLPVLKR